MLRKNFLFLTIYLLSILSISAFAEQSQEKKDGEEHFRIWIGFCRYDMEEFNEKLSFEKNKPIKSEINLGIEFNLVSIQKFGILLKTPLGIEYLDANSVTTHTYNGSSVIVDWKIPVIGVYVAPTISLVKKAKIFYLRPIGIGYYNLGKVIKARLIVTNRSGRLEVSGDSIGILCLGGVKYSRNEFAISIEGGYRWLKFNDVFQEPKGGFSETPGGPPAQPGYLKEKLDYSGFIVKLGIEIQF